MLGVDVIRVKARTVLVCGGACRAFIPGSGPRRAESGGVGDSSGPGPGSSRVWEQILAMVAARPSSSPVAGGSASQTRGQFKSVMTDLAIAIHLNAADYHNNTRELGTGGTSTNTRCGSGVSRVQIFIYSFDTLPICPLSMICRDLVHNIFLSKGIVSSNSIEYI